MRPVRLEAEGFTCYRERQEPLLQAIRAITLAAVGPVVAAELERHGLHATVIPRDAYFMKPLVTALATALARQP